jgi:hypothetical protein
LVRRAAESLDAEDLGRVSEKSDGILVVGERSTERKI